MGIFQDFELGWAAGSDAIGFTDHWAADMAVAQAAEQGAAISGHPPDPEAVAAARRAAIKQEDTGGVLADAAAKEGEQIKHAAKAAGKAAGDVVHWTIGTVLGLVPWYVYAGVGVVLVGGVVAVVAFARSDAGKAAAGAAVGAATKAALV